MHILLLEYDLHIPAAQSLKDKRSVLKSLIARLRQSLNVSVAEVDFQDKWQHAALAVVAVSTIKDHLEEIERAVSAEIEDRGDAIITGSERQWL